MSILGPGVAGLGLEGDEPGPLFAFTTAFEIIILTRMKRSLISGLLVLALTWSGFALAATFESLPANAYFGQFKALKADSSDGLMLRAGDRLAICGDSITEQKMYSRIIETYLTVCQPQLGVTVRQFGWSGERAPGFRNRMTNDVLRFNPTIATTCYGMNDHRYQPYTQEIGDTYREHSLAIIRAFKSRGIRVIQGSAGIVGKMPHWVQSAQGTVVDLNLGLLELRNIDVELAAREQVGFADVFLPMLIQDHTARARWGTNYMVSGQDGVHPGWAGQLVMAYAFLSAMNVEGEIGTVTVDWGKKAAQATEGHEIVSYANGELRLRSSRYPFCAEGPQDQDDSIRSGMLLVPFNERLNRLNLVVKNGAASRYRVSWGDVSRVYDAEALERGVNLAADFQVNPFSKAFQRVDEAVARKQAYETRQIKTLFHGPEGRADMEMTAALTEKVRAPLAQDIVQAFQPVEHTLRIEVE